jgi:hypothetical protein
MDGNNGKKIVLFLGAGASAPFGYPTTKKFVDGLRKELAESVEGVLLSNILKIPEIEDIEQVLEVLKALYVFNKHPLKEYISTFTTTINLPNMSTNVFDQVKIAERLEDKIRSDVFRQYEFSPQRSYKIKDAYAPLIDMLFKLRGDNELPIFTTNYDRVIEGYCHSEGLICIDGFKRNPQTDEFEWNSKEFKRKPRRKRFVKLYKIHGSLNWRRRRDARFVRVSPEERTRGTQRYEKNLVLFPTEKLTDEVERIMLPEFEPYGLLHILFRKILKESEVAVFIGFSFRDAYINDIIISEMHDKKVIIVSPNASDIKEKIRRPHGRFNDSIQISPMPKIIAIDGMFGTLDLTRQIEKAILSKEE